MSNGNHPHPPLHMCKEAYNYNTLNDEDPRNLILLCTSQGMAVQQDGCGAKKLFHHAVDDAEMIHRYWLEAEETHHKAKLGEVTGRLRFGELIWHFDQDYWL